MLGLLLATTVYAQPPKPTITQLFGFVCDSTGQTCPDGENPNSLIQSSDGNFYGTAPFSGSDTTTSFGTVFKVTPSGQLTVIYTFLPNQSGQYPNGANPTSLIEGNDGFLYGTTIFGGNSNRAGVVFKLSKTGVIHILHKFCSLAQCADGSAPDHLMLASDGDFYGATQQQGNTGGVLFRITPTGSYKVLHTFDLNAEGPAGLGMIEASDGNLYGTTVGAQTVITSLFRLTSAGQFTVLHIFHYAQFPDSPPIQAANGKLYGALSRFSDQVRLGIFECNLAGQEFQQIPLQISFNGSIPHILQASDRNLWGTTVGDGDANNGTIISLSPHGKTLQNVSFEGTNGSVPDAVIQGSDGTILGVAERGGSVAQGKVASGVVFTLNTGLAAPKPVVVILSPSSGKVGSQVRIYGDHLVGSTQVTFNGVSTTFQILNVHTVSAIVPQGATTGPIAVTNAGGTTASKKNFTVQ
jgi:uncharacterized repeat protein (TIGR03803 family)